MTRRWMPLVLAGVTAGALASALVPAAEAAQRVARLGIVSPDLPSTATRGSIAFLERLHELFQLDDFLSRF